MGEARRVLDAVTDALLHKSADEVANLYASDAIAVTPDEGELRGRDQIARYLKQVPDAFPDATYESLYGHECGNFAIDEGYIVGTHTAPLATPTGESIPATGRQIRVRACDVAAVDNGLVTSHRFYFDQMEFLGQLGLLPETPS